MANDEAAEVVSEVAVEVPAANEEKDAEVELVAIEDLEVVKGEEVVHEQAANVTLIGNLEMIERKFFYVFIRFEIYLHFMMSPR